MRAVLVAGLAAIALTTGAAAGGCEMTTSQPTLDIAGAYYVVWLESTGTDSIGPCEFGPCVWEETNGISGLQRSDEMRDDTCGGTAGVGDAQIV